VAQVGAFVTYADWSGMTFVWINQKVPRSYWLHHHNVLFCQSGLRPSARLVCQSDASPWRTSALASRGRGSKG